MQESHSRRGKREVKDLDIKLADITCENHAMLYYLVRLLTGNLLVILRTNLFVYTAFHWPDVLSQSSRRVERCSQHYIYLHSQEHVGGVTTSSLRQITTFRSILFVQKQSWTWTISNDQSSQSANTFNAAAMHLGIII